jgi:hypothetical protein
MVEVIIAMIPKFIVHLKMKFSRAVRAIKAGIGSAFYRRVTSVIPVNRGFVGFIVTTGTENAVNAGLRYRKTSGHAPIFSLFSFFADRPTP